MKASRPGRVCQSTGPPSGWSALAPLPCQAFGFGEALATMGYRSLYLWDRSHGALVLLRGAFPGLIRLTARATVFCDGGSPAFVAAALGELERAGIPYVKVGDTMWGPRWTTVPRGWPFRRTRLVPRHTFVLDLTRSDHELLRGMQGSERKVRKSERAGITVREVTSKEDVAAFCRLAKDTGDRVRARTAYTDFPDAFFESIHRLLTPSGTARFYVGWYKDEPLASGLFLCTAETMLYYLGGSTRDRQLTAKQAPAAVFWHAIREARRLGMTRFDFGGCTPTDDPADPRHGVYDFKKRWGGRLETFANLEVVLSPVAVSFQEHVLSPLWDRLHPLYFRLRMLRGARA